MKRTIFLCLLGVLAFLTASAQTFTLSPKTYTGTATCTGLNPFQVGLTNNGSTGLYLGYTLLLNTMPDTACWTQIVCDCNLCHPNNEIPQNDSCFSPIMGGSTKLDFMIYDVSNAKGHYGSGVIKYLVYEKTNPTNRDTLTFIIDGCTSGTACSVGTNENMLEQLTINPSIASDYIVIKNNGTPAHIETLAIYDCIGKAVHVEKNIEISSAKKDINIATLPNGVYFVKLDNKGYSTVKKIVKSN